MLYRAPTCTSTEDYIAQLAADLRPIPAHTMSRRLGVGLATGVLAALIGLTVTLGLRPDLLSAAATTAFWLKWAFTLSLTWATFAIVRRLGRPGGQIGWAWVGLALPVGLVLVAAFAELAATPPTLRTAVWLGQTSVRCPIAIAALAAPVFMSLIWVFQSFAPTRLRLAGFAAGLLAGTAGASVYALSCPETSVAFLATWYVLGLLFAGALGAGLGPRVMKW